MYLTAEGYRLVKKSAGSMEFHKDDDKIVVLTSREPMTYFNRNDSSDKGLFFKYILKREQNFYKAIEKALSITQQTFDGLSLDPLEKTKKKPIKSLESNYHIVPLTNKEFLNRNRGISDDTLNDMKFKGRIFNAYHFRDNGGMIPNTAFPKYDLDGNIKNYILHNKPYRSKIDQKVRKFRLVLNRKTNFLFYSKPPSGEHINIVAGESAMDLLAYKELKGKQDDFYISFGGNVFSKKLEFFSALVQKVTQGKSYSVQSIMDHDQKGFEFDLELFNTLSDSSGSMVYLESHILKGRVGLKFHYNENSRNAIGADEAFFRKHVGHPLLKADDGSPLVQFTRFAQRIVFEFQLNDLTKGFDTGERNLGFEFLVHKLAERYLDHPFKIEKSDAKDWNDELIRHKRPKTIVVPFKDKNAISLGDMIELKLAKGPEGSRNQGRVIEKRNTGVLCDFGLTYRYAIPYSGIKNIIKELKNTSKGTGKEFKNTFKNNNLQNNIL